MDRVLQAERVGRDRAKLLHPAALGGLPDGAMIAWDGRAWLVLGGGLLGWTPFEYDEVRLRRGSRTVQTITPPSILEAIRRGYRPMLHPSAGRTP